MSFLYLRRSPRHFCFQLLLFTNAPLFSLNYWCSPSKKIQYLPHIKYCANVFYTVSQLSQLFQEIGLSLPLYSWVNWGLAKLNNFIRLTKLACDRNRTGFQSLFALMKEKLSEGCFLNLRLFPIWITTLQIASVKEQTTVYVGWEFDNQSLFWEGFNQWKTR